MIFGNLTLGISLPWRTKAACGYHSTSPSLALLVTSDRVQTHTSETHHAFTTPAYVYSSSDNVSRRSFHNIVKFIIAYLWCRVAVRIKLASHSAREGERADDLERVVWEAAFWFLSDHHHHHHHHHPTTRSSHAHSHTELPITTHPLPFSLSLP